MVDRIWDLRLYSTEGECFQDTAVQMPEPPLGDEKARQKSFPSPMLQGLKYFPGELLYFLVAVAVGLPASGHLLCTFAPDPQ